MHAYIAEKMTSRKVLRWPSLPGYNDCMCTCLHFWAANDSLTVATIDGMYILGLTDC